MVVKTTAVKAASRTRKKVKKNVVDGMAHVHPSFNNTIITITDRQGNALNGASPGGCGFRGTPKSPPFAAKSACGNLCVLCLRGGDGALTAWCLLTLCPRYVLRRVLRGPWRGRALGRVRCPRTGGPRR